MWLIINHATEDQIATLIAFNDRIWYYLIMKQIARYVIHYFVNDQGLHDKITWGKIFT